jgi:DNA-binding NtrC family response regulator
MTATILIVDDEVRLARSYKQLLEREGFHVTCVFSVAEAEEQMARDYPDIVLMDRKLPDGDGCELMARLRPLYPGTQFVMITAQGSIRSAVRATREGATDYLTKPFEISELLVAIHNALRERSLQDEVLQLRSLDHPSREDGGPPRYPSTAIRQALELARKASAQDGIVLLLGASGCGKDFMARWIHNHSRRAQGPFFSINCAALAPELAESELFGHEPGAFTGSRGRKRGLLELAAGGTLLLNEIGELSLALQSKLLTFLDTRSFVRVGGERSITIDARLVAATNRDLGSDVERGRFRGDLFYRLNVFPIDIPPLRERTDDLPILVCELLDKLGRELEIAGDARVSAEAMEAMQRYHWPGNIRELRNVLERALILAEGPLIEKQHLSFRDTNEHWRLTLRFDEKIDLHRVTKDVARQLVTEALRRGRNKSEAAAMLNLSRHALAHQIRALGIEA